MPYCEHSSWYSYELLKTNQKAHFEGRKRPKNTLLFSFIFKVIIVLVTELFCKKAKERSTFRRGSNQHWNLVFVTNFNLKKKKEDWSFFVCIGKALYFLFLCVCNTFIKTGVSNFQTVSYTNVFFLGQLVSISLFSLKSDKSVN